MVPFQLYCRNSAVPLPHTLRKYEICAQASQQCGRPTGATGNGGVALGGGGRHMPSVNDNKVSAGYTPGMPAMQRSYGKKFAPTRRDATPRHMNKSNRIGSDRIASWQTQKISTNNREDCVCTSKEDLRFKAASMRWSINFLQLRLCLPLSLPSPICYLPLLCFVRTHKELNCALGNKNKQRKKNKNKTELKSRLI